jgi:hypothetical protein
MSYSEGTVFEKDRRCSAPAAGEPRAMIHIAGKFRAW